MLVRQTQKLAAATAATLIAALAPLAAQARAATAAQPPAAATAAAHAPLLLGVTTAALADNSTWPWTKRELVQVRAFSHLVHAHMKIVMWYADWAHSRVLRSQLNAASKGGALPEITWEPWDYLAGIKQPAYTLASIIAGQHDSYIRAWARALRAYRKPVLLRFAQEMNGSWYPWDEGSNGNRPGQFAQAWRHVHNIFRHARATNVEWVWSPVARGGYPLNLAQYPGDAYVDIVGVSGFNAGKALPPSWGGWRSFAAIFDHSLGELSRLAPTKPIQISEVSSGTKGGSETIWIKRMFRYLATQPEVTSLVWFNVAKQADWRLTSRVAGKAFGRGVRWLAKH